MEKHSHYRLPLKLINSYAWAGLSKPGQAVLIVIGCLINKHKETCSASRATIAEYTGYSNLAQTIDPALKELVTKCLVIKKKIWRINHYYLTDLSRYEKGKSYFPLYRYQIEEGYWAKLKPCEKSSYPVLGLKGVINNPEIEDDPKIYCRGQIKKVKDFCKWTGISRKSFYNSISGLEKKSLLAIDDDGNYDLYRLEFME